MKEGVDCLVELPGTMNVLVDKFGQQCGACCRSCYSALLQAFRSFCCIGKSAGTWIVSAHIDFIDQPRCQQFS